MPRGDGTGPMGMGPMTGRGAGFCAGFGAPGFMNPMPGRGVGMGFGRGRGGWGRGFGGGGRGWRHGVHATGLPGWQRAAMGLPAFGACFGPPMAPAMSREQEIAMLKAQAENMEAAVASVKSRIEELSKEPAEAAEAE